jgi:hypothetical protein
MKKTTVQLIDDLDGSVIADGNGRTVAFAFDGAGYELDLSDANISALADVLAPYISAARSSGPRLRSASTSRPRAASNSADLQKIRDWANANGYTVGDRGRIASSIREAYEAAH